MVLLENSDCDPEVTVCFTQAKAMSRYYTEAELQHAPADLHAAFRGCANRPATMYRC